MNIRRIIKRFNSLFERYDIKGLKAFYWVDYFINYVIYGASINDYFAYHFYKMRPNGKADYITFRRYHKILNICNQKDKIIVFRNKSLFNNKYHDFLCRESIDLNSISENDFVAFIQSNDSFFVKEVFGFRGNSVNYYKSANIDAYSLYHKLKDDVNCHYIVESKLSQHNSLASFHPNSVNTIRIVTVYDDKKDKLHFMFAKLRMGNNGAFLDNTHAGGISGNIDLDSGIVVTPGYSVTSNDEFVFHPYTGKQIVGFQIPYWNECKAFIEKVARITPEIRYVGWDVVILQDGTFALIEANDNADHDGQQIHYRGMWKDYKKLLKELS